MDGIPEKKSFQHLIMFFIHTYLMLGLQKYARNDISPWHTSSSGSQKVVWEFQFLAYFSNPGMKRLSNFGKNFSGIP